MHQGLPNKYQFQNIAPELSVKMFEDHWKLYESYVLQWGETMKQFSNPYDPGLADSASPVSGKLRELESDKTYLTNAILLHELFFENVILPDNSAPMIPGPQFTSLIQKDFPQVKAQDFWSHIIKPTSKAARGWCVVGFSTLEAKIDVAMRDSHGGYIPLGMYPLLVIDMYEHSYSEQYGIDRGTYLDHLLKSINWNIVEHRVATIHSASELMRTSIPEEAEEYIRDQFNDEDKDFGFPGEEDFPDDGKPQATGLDTRNDLSVYPNPRAHGSVEQPVTRADLETAFQRIRTLSTISFISEEDYFDREVIDRSPRFREELWAMLQKES